MRHITHHFRVKAIALVQSTDNPDRAKQAIEDALRAIGYRPVVEESESFSVPYQSGPTLFDGAA